MSTEERYGTEVWDAVCELSHFVERGIYCFVTIGEVAQQAGVSRGTAKKYLEKARNQGHLSRVTLGKSYGYRLLFQSEELS